MCDFNFTIPTEIYFGKDCECKAGQLMQQYAENVMMIYGSDRIFRDGLADRLINSLQNAGCQVLCCGGVKPNAETDWIDSAIEVARRENIEGILAVGGGSVIDSAKAVAAGVHYPGSILQLYETTDAEPAAYLPVGAVVTIPATASESNEMSVISDSRTGRKIAKPMPGTRPKFALLNPQLTLTVSPYQTACGGFDMFAHAFERYFDLRRGSSLLDAMAEAVMHTVIEILPQVLAHPQNLEKRSELMLAATIAHNDMLGPGGDFACHEISHVITERFGVTHGGALAMILPAWCRYMWPKAPERFAQFFKNVWGVNEDSDELVIQKGIEKMEVFIKDTGLPLTVETNGEIEEEAAEIAEAAICGREFIGGGLGILSAGEIRAICKMFLRDVA